MISSLRGTILSSAPGLVVIEVGGVGFSVFVPGDVAHTAPIGEQIRLHTSLIVRDDALTLYGFSSTDELDVFTLLLSVTGVGPKTALGVISHLSVDQIATAVADDQDAVFRKVSGIGPKTAKLIVLQLAGKLHAPAPATQNHGLAQETLQQLVTALVGLGWPEKVAAEAAEASAADASETERASVALLLRRTLSTLGPAKGSARV